MDNYYNIKTHVSNSMLGWLDVSPAYYLYKLGGGGEEKESKSLENGKLLHYYIENPDSFIVEDFDKPTEKALEFLNAYYECLDIEKAKEKTSHGWSVEVLKNKVLNTESGKKYLEFLAGSRDKLVLSKEQKFLIDNAIKSIKNNPLVAPLVYDDNGEVYKELEIYWEKELTNGKVNCKGKLDKVKIDHEKKKITIIDYKSTFKTPFGLLVKTNSFGSPQLDYVATGWFKSFLNFKYYRQAGMYYDAVSHQFKELINKGYKIEFLFVVIQLSNISDIAVYSVSDLLMGYGLSEQNDLLCKYNHYMQTGDWSTPVESRKIITI